MFKLVEAPADEPNAIGFLILEDIDEEEPFGTMIVYPQGDTIYIHDIETAEGPGSLGVQAVRDIIRQLQKRFPNAKHIQGIRTTGTRGRFAPEGVLRPEEASLVTLPIRSS